MENENLVQQNHETEPASNYSPNNNPNVGIQQRPQNKASVFTKYGMTFIVLNIIMIMCFLTSIAMLSKGQDKVNNYYNSSYSSENAYVGGDAYNYIINANYATGYYVLSTGFMITGTLCGCTGQIINNRPNNTKSK